MKNKKKMIIFALFISLTILISTSFVVAKEDYKLVNNNEIKITNEEYNNLLNLGFSKSEIQMMSYEEYENNKLLKGKIVSENSIDVFSDNSNFQKPSIAPFSNQPGSVETTYKKIVTTIIEINGKYRYKVSVTWKNIPSTRSYDIIGIGMDSTVKAYSNPTFQQNYCDTNNNCSSTNTYTKNTSSVGIGASFKLPSGSLSSLSSYFYYDVEKRNANSNVTNQNAYGDYAHATKSITQENSTNYTVNRGGIILDDSIINYYDETMTSTAKWTGNW